jgi:hypothetical protein
VNERTILDRRRKGEIREVRKLVVREAAPIVTSGVLPVGGKRPDVFASHGGVVVAPNHSGTVLSHQLDAPSWIGVVPDDIAQTVHRVNVEIAGGSQGPFEGFQIRVDVGKNGESHKRRGNSMNEYKWSLRKRAQPTRDRGVYCVYLRIFMMLNRKSG